MKSLSKILLLAIVYSFMYGNLHAQKKEYTPVINENGIEISYRWTHSKILKKDSPLMLFLKIHNSNDYHAALEFTVDYYWKGIRNASSEPSFICVKSGRSARGRIKKLTFDRAKFSDEDLMSENFTLDIPDLRVEKVERCKKR